MFFLIYRPNLVLHFMYSFIGFYVIFCSNLLVVLFRLFLCLLCVACAAFGVIND